VVSSWNCLCLEGERRHEPAHNRHEDSPPRPAPNSGRRSVTDAKSGGGTGLRLARNRPKKADHLPRDRGRHDDLGFAGRREPTIAGTEPDLRFPGDVADDLWKSLEPVVQLAADAGLHSIGPSPFDQDTPCKRVACLGDAAAADCCPARMLGRRQTKVGHHLARIVEADEIAHFGDDGDSRHEGHAAHCLERLNDGRHGPSWNQILDLLHQATDPLFGVMNGMAVVLQHDLLGRVVEAKRRQPAAIGQRLSFLSGIDAAMP
jgi:hypothetical protein